jgi:hypothetical protein
MQRSERRGDASGMRSVVRVAMVLSRRIAGREDWESLLEERPDWIDVGRIYKTCTL